MKTTNYKITNAMKTLAVSFIILVSLSGFAPERNSAVTTSVRENSEAITTNNQELAGQIESWINNSAYWSNETASEEQEAGLDMKSWIDNGSFWRDDVENENQELTVQLKSWINDGALWSREDEMQEQDLHLQIKEWISTCAFWNEADDAITFTDTLANN